MKRSSAFFATVFTLLFCVGTLAQAQEIQSRFLPDREYSVTIKKTLSGHDGFQEVIPVTSTRRITIVTGPHSGSGMHVTLTAYTSVQATRNNAEDVQWVFDFEAMDDGTLADVEIVSGAEPMAPELAFAMLSRTLQPVLFETAYTLERRDKDVVKFVKNAPRDGAEDFIDIEYTVDKSASEKEEGESREPMATEDSGTATFHAGDQFFLERVLNEVNRIYVAEDALGEEKNVIMRKDLRITATITER
ncbi:MAG: hypothetical protein C0600_03395 [Ignavibacteria bacterium]|nr:MAG: hypothetical protein C0600_03395 [Ignavibacteria bacterium]